jgi:uncharacterized membrane protein
MICSHCATEMPAISAYCPKCGGAVASKPEAEAYSGSIFLAVDLKEAILAALSYLTIIPAIVLLVAPQFRDKGFIRFHAWQSILFSVAAASIGLAMRVIFAILSFVPFLGFLFAWLAAGVVFLALVMLWAVLVVKAGQGEGYELPWLGHLASRLTAPHAG